jgi:2-amino-4-hydroxy-6-hydroxymethyldihydropteridine diphosphokinase
MTRAEVFLGLGSNQGERRAHIEGGLEALERGGIAICRRSALYETEPVGLADQPWFLNLVVNGTTELTPQSLLRLSQHIEKDAGRVTGVRFGPRPLDIDILLYDDQIVRSERLEIPHPRLHERRFVLVPLVEIAGEARDPRNGRRFAEILAGLGDEKKVTRSKENAF